MARPTNDEARRRNIAKAMSKMTPERIQKLEAAFIIDATVAEACFYAGISESTYYNWMERNPDLLERLTALRNTPVLKARESVVASLGDPAHAFRYLERKRPDEFGSRSKLELSGEVKTDSPERDSPAVKAVVAEFEGKLKQAIVDSHKKPVANPAP